MPHFRSILHIKLFNPPVINSQSGSAVRRRITQPPQVVMPRKKAASIYTSTFFKQFRFSPLLHTLKFGFVTCYSEVYRIAYSTAEELH